MIVPIIGVLLLSMVLVTMYSSVRVVEEGDLEALLVLGEMRAVLRPGLNVVPPFVSTTYPIDRTTMQIEKGHDRVAVPEEFEDDVRDRAG